MIRVTVNGKPHDVADGFTVEELIGSLGLPADGRGIAVAVNETVVPRTQWAAVRVTGGDSIEVIHAVQGG